MSHWMYGEWVEFIEHEIKIHEFGRCLISRRIMDPYTRVYFLQEIPMGYNELIGLWI